MCVCVCVCVCSCFIHLSIDGRLGCFNISAIANNAIINIGVYISFQISHFGFFRYIPRSRTARSYSSSIFSFLRSCYTVLTVAVQICIPTNNVWGFPFLHVLIRQLIILWHSRSNINLFLYLSSYNEFKALKQSEGYKGFYD